MAKNNAPTEAPAEAATPAPAEAFPLPVDEWHGKGGEYVIENGVRRRVGGPPVGPELPADA